MKLTFTPSGIVTEIRRLDDGTVEIYGAYLNGGPLNEQLETLCCGEYQGPVVILHKITPEIPQPADGVGRAAA